MDKSPEATGSNAVTFIEDKDAVHLHMMQSKPVEMLRSLSQGLHRTSNAVSATSSLMGFLSSYEKRFGRHYPGKLRISERTVLNLAAEMQPRRHWSEDPPMNYLQAAREGRAEFCGIKIELTHA